MSKIPNWKAFSGASFPSWFYCVPCQRLLLRKAHNTKQTFQRSNLEFPCFLLEVSICCTIEIYNEGTTYKNLYHLNRQNHFDRQPCWTKTEIDVSQEVWTTWGVLFLDNFTNPLDSKNLNAKSFIASKINIIAKVSMCYSYTSFRTRG